VLFEGGAGASTDVVLPPEETGGGRSLSVVLEGTSLGFGVSPDETGGRAPDETVGVFSSGFLGGVSLGFGGKTGDGKGLFSKCLGVVSLGLGFSSEEPSPEETGGGGAPPDETGGVDFEVKSLGFGFSPRSPPEETGGGGAPDETAGGISPEETAGVGTDPPEETGGASPFSTEPPIGSEGVAFSVHGQLAPG
jgi:hypothetical protein